MRRTCAVLFLAAVASGLAGCLEHRERVEIAEDGSVEVTVFAKGGAQDLADNPLVPTGGPWAPRGADVAAWRARGDGPFDEKPWRRPDGTVRDDVEIGAAARFANVDALPRTYASEGDPYAEAGFRFTTTVRTRREGDRVVTLFERRYRAVPGAVRRIGKALGDRVAKRIERLERIWGETPLTAEEKADVADALAEALLEMAGVVTREALAAHYVRGAATLPLAARARVLADVRAAVGRFAAREPLVAVLDAERAAHGRKEEPGRPPEDEPLAVLDRDVRAAIRSELRASLGRAGVAEGEVNGILAALEVANVDNDRAQDLDDEDFVVEVALPGTIVGGNFESAEGNVARFRFHGSDLQDREVVLHAESVAERAR